MEENFEEMEKRINKDLEEFDLSETFNMPGSFAALGLVALAAPFFGILPQSVSDMMLAVFSLPVLFVFVIEVILNKNINIYKNVAMLLIFSYLLLIARRFDMFVKSFESFLSVNILFSISLLLSFLIIFLYWIFFKYLPKFEKIIPKKQEIDMRFKFVFSLLPSALISLIVIFLLDYFGFWAIL